VRVRLKTRVPETDPTVDSLTPLYGSAHFMERECHEMYGIAFRGNRDLRPILPFDQPERASIELACDLKQMFGEVSTNDAIDLSTYVRDRGLPNVLDFPFQDAAAGYAAGASSALGLAHRLADDDYFRDNPGVKPYGLSNAPIAYTPGSAVCWN
jgi:hypothetical protein